MADAAAMAEAVSEQSETAPAAEDVVEGMAPKVAAGDVSWTTELSTRAVAQNVAESLWQKGYCVISMESELEQQSAEIAQERLELLQQAKLDALHRTDWTLPKPEFETSFLGHGSRSKVVWLEDLPPRATDADLDALGQFRRRVGTLAAILLPAVREVLGFRPGTHLSGSLLRAPLDAEGLEQEPLSEEEVRAGLVENHIDFLQRRRLCMMYVLDDSGGYVDLVPRPELNEEPVRLSLPAGKLLVFRSDLMGYSYVAKGFRDLVLQSWFMEEAQELSLGSVHGDQASFESIFGGPPMDPHLQVHIMSAHGRIPGKCNNIDHVFSMIRSHVDCFRAIPLHRWDMDLYYTSESGQFATAGKSVQKHAGLLMEEDLIYFDNNFFGVDKKTAHCIPPCQRVLLETGYELLLKGGYTRKTLLGAHLIANIADVGTEWDPFMNYGDNGDWEGWCKASSGGSSMSSVGRLCHILGLTGPTLQVDTACSASLVAACIMHSALTQDRPGTPKGGFFMGMGNLLSPFPFIGLSAAGMIGRSGRSRTFDSSANGFARGEGMSGVYCKRSTDVEAAQNRLGTYLTSWVNQDGRSASLTAPNGPSQQACIRASMRSGNIDPNQCCSTENHGTGTALGDPIETGSIAAVFRKFAWAFPVVSHKPNTGHLEGGAGAVGFIKTLMTLINSVFPGNNHLRELNAHMAEDGFPGFFPVEIGDIPMNDAVMGLNAFGFGGTNSRSELWAPGRRTRNFHEVIHRGLNGLRVDKLGPASLLPKELMLLDSITVQCNRCGGDMCWLCGDALPDGHSGKHCCYRVREDLSSYDICSNCYDFGGGKYSSTAWRYLEALDDAEKGDCPGHGHEISLAGTWDAWAGLQQMEEVTGGRYKARIVLGETLVERFRLVMTNDRDIAIFPASGSDVARVMGPQKDAQMRCWTLDGRNDGAVKGSVYEVELQWDSDIKVVGWRNTGERAAEMPFAHSYSIARSNNKWRPEPMRQVSEGVWEWRGEMRKNREDLRLHFLRDGDWRQRVYPPLAGDDVPVVGPDAGGQDQGWPAVGRRGHEVCARLRVADGALEVSVATNEPGEPVKEKRYHSLSGPVRDLYSLVGPWSNGPVEGWSFLQPDAENPQLQRIRFPIGRTGREQFHLLANGSAALALFPPHARAVPGVTAAQGPAYNTLAVNWEVMGRKGQEVEVVLDLSAENRSEMVTCRLLMGAEALEAPRASGALEDDEEEDEE